MAESEHQGSLAKIDFQSNIEKDLKIGNANEFIKLHSATVDKWFHIHTDLNALLQQYAVPFTVTIDDGLSENDPAATKSGGEFVNPADDGKFTSEFESLYQHFVANIKDNYTSQTYKPDPTKPATKTIRVQLEEELISLLDQATGNKYNLASSYDATDPNPSLSKLKGNYTEGFCNGLTIGDATFGYDRTMLDVEDSATVKDSFHSQSWTRAQLSQVLEVATREMGRRELVSEAKDATESLPAIPAKYKLSLRDGDSIACCINVEAKHSPAGQKTANQGVVTFQRKWGIKITQTTPPAAT